MRTLFKSLRDLGNGKPEVFSHVVEEDIAIAGVVLP